MRSSVLGLVLLFVVCSHGHETSVPTYEEVKKKCRQDCDNLGFYAGYFIDGQCWCHDAGTSTLQRLTEIKPERIEAPSAGGDKCTQSCTKLGMDGGFFQNGHCWCFGNDKIEEAGKQIAKCNQECVDLGMSGGFYKDGHCWCYDNEQSGKALTKVQLEETHYRFQVIPHPESADCNKECIKAGMNGGFFKDGWCYCFALEPTGDATLWSLPSEPRKPRIPEIPNCNKYCVDFGMSGGYEKDGECWCYKLEISGDATLTPLSEFQTPKSKITQIAAHPASSNPSFPSWWQPWTTPYVIRDCNKDCMKFRMSGGYFKDGQCWCYEWDVSGDATLKALSELQSPKQKAPGN